MPVYAGCPDIQDYFDPASMLIIDTDNFEGSVQKIEYLLEEDPYDAVLPLIKRQKKVYLESYHIFSKLPLILEQHFNANLKKQKITIHSENSFQRGSSINHFVNSIQSLFKVPDRWRFNLHFKQDDLYSNRL
jgi:hypothetical protein